MYLAAKQDLLDGIGYLNTLSPDAALRYYDLPTEKIASLSQLPDRCPHPKDFALAAKGYRYLIVQDYLIFYVVTGRMVQIRRIPYGRRDYRTFLQ